MEQLEQARVGVNVETGPVDKSLIQKNSELCQLQSDLDKLHEHQVGENLAFGLTEKDEEIKVLKERCDTRYQRIKTLEQQTIDLAKQAKQFEIDYRVEVEENQSLHSDIEKLKHQLDTQTSVTDLDEDDVDREITEYRKALSVLKSQVKSLNEDIETLRKHSKDQSHQILNYRQQAEMSEAS